MTEKLSQFTISTPGITDYICGATAGSPNKRFSFTAFIGISPAPGNLDFYVATTGSDSNPGTIGSPFATIQHAVSVAGLFNYQGTFSATIHVAAGTYTLSSSVKLPPLFQSSGGTILGDTVTPSNCILFDSGGNGIFTTGGAGSVWNFAGFRFDTSATVFGLFQAGGKWILVDANEWTDRTASGTIKLVNCTNFSAFDCFAATITMLDTSFGSFANLFDGGRVTFEINTINFQANSSMNAFVVAIYLCFYGESSNTYSNFATMTGHQITLTEQSIVSTDTGTLANLGGNSVGTVDTTSSIIGAGALGIFATSFAGIPTTTQLPQSETWGVFKDTSGGGVYVAFNDAGTIKKVQLV